MAATTPNKMPETTRAREPTGRWLHVCAGALPAAFLTLACASLAAGQADPQQAGAQQEGGDQRQAAAAAYDRGTAAYLQDDYARAAAWFETAHRLAPAAPALIQAVRAYHKADDMPRALTLALRLQQEYPDDPRASTLSSDLLEAHRNAFTRVEVVCQACEVDLDGKLQDGTVFFIEPETQHEVSAVFQTGRASKQVSGTAAQTLEITFSAPPPMTLDERGGATPGDPSPTRIDDSNLPPLAVYIGAGLTGALLIGTLTSWIDAMNKAEPYDDVLEQGRQAGCPNAADADLCAELGQEARKLFGPADNAETRTNVLLVGTLVSATATGVLAAFFTDWDGTADDRARTPMSWGVASRGDGVFADLRGEF